MTRGILSGVLAAAVPNELHLPLSAVPSQASAGPASVVSSTTAVPPPHSNVYLRNLPLDTTEALLRALAGAVGPVESVRLLTGSRSSIASVQDSSGPQQPRGPVALIKFATVDDAQAAIQAFDGFHLGNCMLDARLADSDAGSRARLDQPPVSDNLFVKGLPPGCSKEQLAALFSSYGTVTSCRVLHHGDAASVGQGGAALVRLSSEEEARRAVAALHGQRIPGGLAGLTVRFADNPEIKARKAARAVATQAVRCATASAPLPSCPSGDADISGRAPLPPGGHPIWPLPVLPGGMYHAPHQVSSQPPNGVSTPRALVAHGVSTVCASPSRLPSMQGQYMMPHHPPAMMMPYMHAGPMPHPHMFTGATLSPSHLMPQSSPGFLGQQGLALHTPRGLPASSPRLGMFSPKASPQQPAYPLVQPPGRMSLRTPASPASNRSYGRSGRGLGKPPVAAAARRNQAASALPQGGNSSGSNAELLVEPHEGSNASFLTDSSSSQNSIPTMSSGTVPYPGNPMLQQVFGGASAPYLNGIDIAAFAAAMAPGYYDPMQAYMGWGDTTPAAQLFVPMDLKASNQQYPGPRHTAGPAGGRGGAAGGMGGRPSSNGAPVVVPTAGNSSASLYVRNVPPDADKLFLYEKFSPFGAILSCRLLTDDAGRSKGVGFVNFADPLCAAQAVAALHNLPVGDHPLHVAFQAPRAR